MILSSLGALTRLRRYHKRAPSINKTSMSRAATIPPVAPPESAEDEDWAGIWECSVCTGSGAPAELGMDPEDEDGVETKVVASVTVFDIVISCKRVDSATEGEIWGVPESVGSTVGVICGALLDVAAGWDEVCSWAKVVGELVDKPVVVDGRSDDGE